MDKDVIDRGNSISIHKLIEKMLEQVDMDVKYEPLKSKMIFRYPNRRVVAIDISRFPHSCPRCKKAAYIGLQSVECSDRNCV